MSSNVRVLIVTMPWSSVEMYRPVIETLRAGWIGDDVVSLTNREIGQAHVDSLCHKNRSSLFIFVGTPNLWYAPERRVPRHQPHPAELPAPRVLA